MKIEKKLAFLTAHIWHPFYQGLKVGFFEIRQSNICVLNGNFDSFSVAFTIPTISVSVLPATRSFCNNNFNVYDYA